MAFTNDATVLNAMATSTNVSEWQTPAFDAVQLNDTNQPTRLYRSSSVGACGQLIIKSGQDSWWYDNVAFTINGGIRGDKLLVMWIKMFAPATTTILNDIFTGMYDTAGSRGGNGGRWQQDLMMEVADHYGWWPATMYPTQPDETLGTFASMAKGSMDCIELAVDNSGAIDVKLAALGACHTLSYIGAHGQAITYDGLLTYAKDKTTPRDWGIYFKTGPNSYRCRVVIRVGDAAATVATTLAEVDKSIYFDNVNTDHEIGYDFINATGGATISFTVNGGTREWNDGNSDLWVGENNVDTWTPANITWVNGGGGASLPTHVTGKTTNGHTFKNCGPIDIGDAITEDCIFKDAPGAAVLYTGTGTRRIKNATYLNNVVGARFDTAQTITMDGDTFSGNTYDIENSSGATGGVEGVADSYAEGNQNLYTNLHNLNSKVAQSFTGDGNTLSRAELYLRKFNSPTGTITATLYAHSGTFGVSSLPTGTALATSITTIDASALTTSFALINFNFDNTYTLVNGTNYCIAVEFANGDATNTVRFGADTLAPTHGGNAAAYLIASSTWSVRSRDQIFYVHTKTPIVGSGALTADSYSETNQNATTALDGAPTAVGQAITGNGGVLSNIRWHLSKTGSPTGNAVCKLYAHSGTFGTSSIPTGTPLATSVNVDVSLLTGTLALTQFEFEDQYTLDNTTNYVIALEYTGDASNYISVGTDTTTPTHGGNFSTLTGTWSAVAGTDGIFYVSTGGILIVNATNGANPSTKINTSVIPGAVIIQNAVTVKVTAVTITNTPIQNVRVYLKTDPGGIVILNGLTDVNGEISAAYNYSSDQNVIGWARKSTATPLYKEAPLVGTITSAGLNAAATMILDE